jgi:hypothetical protein
MQNMPWQVVPRLTSGSTQSSWHNTLAEAGSGQQPTVVGARELLCTGRTGLICDPGSPACGGICKMHLLGAAA